MTGSETTTPTTKPDMVPPAPSGKRAHAYRYKGQAAPGEMPDMDDNHPFWLQGLLIAAGFDIHSEKSPTGQDNYYGPLTHAPVVAMAKEAGVAVKDISIRTLNDPATKFLAVVKKHIDAHAPAPVAKGPTPEELAAEAARKAAADAAAKAAAEEARIRPEIRGTQYDPRNLAKLSDGELNNVLKDGLHDIGEITGGVFGSYRRNGALGPVTTEKVKEQQRKLLGVPEGEEALDRASLEQTAAALGIAVAEKNHLAPRSPVADPLIPASINGTQYDPRNIAQTSDAELINILKDGLHSIGEISGGPLGSYRRNGELGPVTTEKVKEQQRKLLGVPEGQESLDRATLEATAIALGEKVAERKYLSPEMQQALGAANDQNIAPIAGSKPENIAPENFDTPPSSGPVSKYLTRQPAIG